MWLVVSSDTGAAGAARLKTAVWRHVFGGTDLWQASLRHASELDNSSSKGSIVNQRDTRWPEDYPKGPATNAEIDERAVEDEERRRLRLLQDEHAAMVLPLRRKS